MIISAHQCFGAELSVLRGCDDQGAACIMPKLGDDRFSLCLAPILWLAGATLRRAGVFVVYDEMFMVLREGAACDKDCVPCIFPA